MISYDEGIWDGDRPGNPPTSPYVEWAKDDQNILVHNMTCDWEKQNLYIRVAAFAKEVKSSLSLGINPGTDQINIALQLEQFVHVDNQNTGKQSSKQNTHTMDPLGKYLDSNDESKGYLVWDNEGRSRAFQGLLIDGKKSPRSSSKDGVVYTYQDIKYRIIAKCVDVHLAFGKCTMKRRIEWECRAKPATTVNTSSASAAWGAPAVLLAGALAGALMA